MKYYFFFFCLGNGGARWTDGGAQRNGLISAIELRTGWYVDSIRVKEGSLFIKNIYWFKEGFNKLSTVN